MRIWRTSCATTLAFVTSIALVRGGQNVTTIPAQSQFADRLNSDGSWFDLIRSDGRGMYIDGQQGVTGHFFTTIGQQDWVQTLKNNGYRYIIVDLTTPLISNSTTAPTGVFHQYPTINVDNIGGMGIGAVEQHEAVLDLSFGKLRFDNTNYSTLVSVTRNVGCTWLIDSGANGQAWLQQTVKGSAVWTATYIVRFAVTVSYTPGTQCAG